ncbi:hypothetical protein RRG08_065938 [Elysia crispata]|uniref:NADH dehydrogenase [ubiquinone] 1 beta subcomplex subunit 8, mitochondrial n=1 Tax=Elysia crispata TaxID=231223 RepID=A0AAE1DFD5_9GAST|nr:hypothetical protein RRG08_065938 [Elysia crispata]
MATFMKVCTVLAKHKKPLFCLRRSNLSTTSVLAAFWNKDWKPGPIPRTPEERAAAAKKYGLRPEDYNALADGDIGDYPDLPLVARSWRDPFEDYDLPGEKRNFGEPVHASADIIGADLWDPNADGRYTYGQMLLYCALTFFGFLTAFLVLSPYQYFPPEMPKQYPFNNLYLEKGGDPADEPEIKHYTFKAPQE